ncbi:hypothetical protein BX070DRAFT_221376 [Coemansia spiralis]|nr:hypothetical protein BX070DRAFT_221376 [Coemansia spiralis]
MLVDSLATSFWLFAAFCTLLLLLALLAGVSAGAKELLVAAAATGATVLEITSAAPMPPSLSRWPPVAAPVESSPSSFCACTVEAASMVQRVSVEM